MLSTAAREGSKSAGIAVAFHTSEPDASVNLRRAHQTQIGEEAAAHPAGGPFGLPFRERAHQKRREFAGGEPNRGTPTPPAHLTVGALERRPHLHREGVSVVVRIKPKQQPVGSSHGYASAILSRAEATRVSCFIRSRSV